MKQRWKAFSVWISTALGFDIMGKRYQTLSYIYLFLMIFTTIEGVFVNTLLHRISGNMTYVILYRGMSYVASAVFMNVAAAVSQKTNSIFVLRLGGIFYLISYIALVFGMDYMEHMRFVIPILSGLGGSFYWSAHNHLVLAYSDNTNRDLGISIMGIMQGVTTLVIPVITGFVISLLPGNLGYQTMFSIGMIVVVVQLFFAARLSPIPESGEKKKSQFRLAFQLIKKEATYRQLLLYEYIRGVRDGVFGFLLNMLLFEIIAAESLTGINTFLTGIMAIFGSWVYGKFVLPRLRGRYMAVATTVLLIFSSLLFLKMSVATLMIFTALNAFLQLFLLNSGNNTSFDITSQSPEARRCNLEMFGLREVAITLGRVAGLVFFYFMPQKQVGYVIVICALTAVQYISAIIVKNANETLALKWEAQEAALLATK